MIRDSETGEELRALNIHERTTDVKISPDGSQIVCGCVDGTIKVWTAKFDRETRRLTGHMSDVLSDKFAICRSALGRGRSDFVAAPAR